MANYILFLILMSIIVTPIFSPIGFYLLYLRITDKIKENEELKSTCNNYLFASITVFCITLLACIIFNYDAIIRFKNITLFIVSSSFLFFLVIKILSCIHLKILVLDEKKVPKRLKLVNFIFNATIIILFVVMMRYFVKTEINIQNKITSNIPNFIETYAIDNEYILFDGNYTKFESNSNSSWLVNENLTNYSFIGDDDTNIIIIHDKVNPSNSFEIEYNYLSNDNKLETKYADILDNFYIGLNYAPVCYLINQNEANLIYGLAQKDEKTDEFYVAKYVKFNMLTGEFTDLQKYVK